MTDIEKELWIQNAEAHDQIVGMLTASIVINLITFGILVWGVFVW